jgi:hypothetical protein
MLYELGGDCFVLFLGKTFFRNIAEDCIFLIEVVSEE